MSEGTCAECGEFPGHWRHTKKGKRSHAFEPQITEPGVGQSQVPKGTTEEGTTPPPPKGSG